MRIDKEIKALIYSSLFFIDEHYKELIQGYLSDNLDWDKFWKLVGTYELYGILYYHLFTTNHIKAGSIPSAYEEQLKQLYMRCIARNRVMFEEIRDISEEFEYQGIELIFLKGPVTIGRLYNNDIGLRGFGDLDVLVRKEDVENTRDILKSLDYKRECEISPESVVYGPEVWPTKPHEEPMMKKGNSIFVPSYFVEMHRTEPYYEIDVDKMMDASVKETCDSLDLRALSRIDDVIMQLTHAYQHILTIYAYRTLSLRMFAEIRESLRIIWKTDGLDSFVGRVIELNAMTPVYTSLVHINYIYDNFVPLKCLEAVKPTENRKNQLRGERGCGVYYPSSFNEMLMLDKVEDIASWNGGLNGVPYGESVILGALHLSPGALRARMLKEIQEKRWDKHELNVVKTPDVNGNLEAIDWNSIEENVLPEDSAEINHFFGTNVRRGTNPRESLGMKFKFAWDNSYLYANAEISDDIPIYRKGKKGDGITLNFDRGDSLFHCGLFPDPDGNLQVFKFLNEKWLHVADSSIIGKCTFNNKKGYSIKAAIPWEELGIEAEDGKSVGFDIELIDFTADVDAPEFILVWSGGKGLGWRRKEVWGRMIL